VTGALVLEEAGRDAPFDAADLEALELLANETAIVLAKLARSGPLVAPKPGGDELAARFPRLVGASKAMSDLRKKLAPLSESDVTVLVTGERGTGKELVARSLHEGGPRCGRPFESSNAAAIPDTMLESELFGVVKGAFTGADRSRPGLLRRAEDGTVFLDEIGDLTLLAQAKLLRVLQEMTVRALGGETEKDLPCRIICATNQDLEALADQGKFRRDLIDRFTVRVHVPPLRERKGDIPLLIAHFLPLIAAHNGRPVPHLDDAVRSALITAPWPGNVRELEAALTRAVMHDLALGPITAAVLGVPALKVSSYTQNRKKRPPTAVEIAEAIARNGGDKSKAADELGVGRTSLYRYHKNAGRSS
jgi:transcriptional regulator with PAS, ATPase and Fis domain